MADYRAAALVDDMYLRGYLPEDNSDFRPDVVLRLMSDELRGYVVELLRDADGDHLVVPIVVDVAAGQESVRVPHRAVANGVRRVAIVREGHQDQQLAQVSADDQQLGVAGYFFRGGRLVFSPSPSQALRLRLDCLLRPSELVSTDYGTITSVTPSGDSVAIGFSGSVGLADGPQRMDLVRASPPFDALAVEALGTLAGSVWTVPAADLIEVPEVGDYLCEPDTSPVPQVPLELHALLSQRVSAMVLQSIGDSGAGRAYDRCEEMRAQCLRLLTPRDIGARHYLISALSRGVERVRGRRR